MTDHDLTDAPPPTPLAPGPPPPLGISIPPIPPDAGKTSSIRISGVLRVVALWPSEVSPSFTIGVAGVDLGVRLVEIDRVKAGLRQELES